MSVLLAPLRAGGRLLDRVELVIDGSESARSQGAARVRQVLAAGAAVSGIAFSVMAVAGGNAPGMGHVLMLIVAAALYANRFGRFLRDWAPVSILIVAYVLAFQLVSGLTFRVWYWPQIHADELLGAGTLPTYRLQDWFGAGDNHALAVVSAIVYMSHFMVPPLIGFYFWWNRRGVGFKEYMYSLIVVNLLATALWVLTPTAPPWLAGREGLIAPPVDVLRMGLNDMGLHQLTQQLHAGTYLIAAAVPSIHASWPLLGTLAARKHRLSRWLRAAILVHLSAVWFVIVYSGEHYVVDILAGVAFSLAAWALVQRVGARLSAAPPGEPSPDAEQPDVEVIRVPASDRAAAR
jgi:hypothetical protein